MNDPGPNESTNRETDPAPEGNQTVSLPCAQLQKKEIILIISHISPFDIARPLNQL